MLNVDPELVNFGQYASSQLRNISASLKGIGINSAQQTAQIYQQTSTSYSGYGGYWGGGYSYYTEWRNVDGERRAVRATERAKGASSAQGIAKQLADDTVKMRASLTEKYKTNF